MLGLDPSYIFRLPENHVAMSIRFLRSKIFRGKISDIINIKNWGLITIGSTVKNVLNQYGITPKIAFSTDKLELGMEVSMATVWSILNVTISSIGAMVGFGFVAN